MSNRPIIIDGKQGEPGSGTIVIQQVVYEIRFLAVPKRFRFYAQDII